MKTISKDGEAEVTAIKEALSVAGMPRTSKLAGAEIRGWTKSLGSTGFSIRDADDHLEFNVILCGKAAGLRYREYSEYNEQVGVMGMHEPMNPEIVAPSIKAVFEDLGYKVQSVRSSGWQLHWDHDVEYTVSVEKE